MPRPRKQLSPLRAAVSRSRPEKAEEKRSSRSSSAAISSPAAGTRILVIGKSSGQRARLAETVSAELDRKLHRIDVGALEGRYTGETEKNLDKLFDAAEAGGGILFFDEADALFGRRTTVKDAHDRYASQSVNYLLDRIEQTRSVVIFATARPRNIDSAFLRRLRFAIKLVAPEKTRQPARRGRTVAKPRSRRTR